MVIVDDGRRYVDANPPARAVLALTLEEIRHLRIDDLTPPHLWRLMDAMWDRLLETGRVMSREVARPEGNYLGMSYYAVANVLPGRHLIAFAPPGWTHGNGAEDPPEFAAERPSPLTRREHEVLALAADGLNGPSIAAQLVLSTATVRTHFGHIYRKLEVSDRAAAVAKAMRLGLIR
jgi:DNA-binding CsgD family transcriptional regulator